MHVHVTGPDGEAKFWLEPVVALAMHHGLNARQLQELQHIVERKRDEIITHWRTHFKH